MELWLERSFWFSVIMVVVITLGYPAFLWLLGPLARRSRRRGDAEPTVSLIIAAYNEESCIRRKLENALALDYPRDRLEIVLVSDGSTDRTDSIAESFRDRGVRLLRFPRTGKTGIQNAAVRNVMSEILVFSDANAMYRPDAIRALVRNFEDTDVACVCGQLVYQRGEAGAGRSESSYWSYEKFIKERESALSSLIGANGSIYAVRRSDYVEIDEDLISDLVEPLALVRQGKRVVYEPQAVSEEEASHSYQVEFRRKVRILTRSIRGILHMRALLNPLHYGIFSLQLLMHKLLRYFVPLFLVTGALSLTILAALGIYRPLFIVSLLLVAAAMVVGSAGLPARKNPVARALHLLYYYLVVNYALVLAWINILVGSRMVLWAPERKRA